MILFRQVRKFVRTSGNSVFIFENYFPAEREKLFDEVETEWAKKESRNLVKSQEGKLDEGDSEIDEDSEECITKGRNVALNAFYRIARNTMSMYFKTNEPTPQEVSTNVLFCT